MIVRGLYCVVVFLLLMVSWAMFTMSRAFNTLETMPGIASFSPPGVAADVQLLAFVDYGSSYSRDANAPLMQAVVNDGKTRIMFFPVPQGSQVSVRAALVLLAAAKQTDNVTALHDAMMLETRPLTEEVLTEIAGRLEMDGKKLMADSRSPEITKKLTEIINAVRDLHVTVTPTVIANQRVFLRPVNDPLGLGEFTQLIRDSRK